METTKIILKCPLGVLGVKQAGDDRIIVCLSGSNKCVKPINQGIFTDNCYLVVEDVKNEETIHHGSRPF